MRAHWVGAAGLAALLSLSAACLLGSGAGRGPLTLADAAERAQDPARRASMRLVQAASAALHRDDPEGARSLAERALRVDGVNPYAYLVLGEAEAAVGDADLALANLDRAEGLLAAREPESRLFRARALLRAADLLERSGSVDAARERRERARSLLAE
ncbi:MAG: hypothetical protein ACE5IL_04450 [Myxococcota bacterium]